ncbi:MFS transporter [Brevibacterium oceani]|uniref:MFS transporter n=1 Tax=Brevibacterium oceani TaxID=358099 RepID=UPI001B320623|nr:MFS transporter [Brevibacterium oceani]
MTTAPKPITDPVEEHPVGAATWPRPRRGFIPLLGLTVATAYGALLAQAVLTLSLKSNELDAENATTVLSIVVAVGSIAALIGNPLLGRLSDRTLSRIGRRRPYLLLGAAAAVLGAFLAVAATSTALLAASYVVTTAGMVSITVACAAIVPDQIAPDKRGAPSAMIGLGAPIGAVIGLFLAQLVQPNLTAMFLLPAAVSALTALILALTIKDRRLERSERPRFSFRELLMTFWVDPRRSPSFAWAWASRLMIFFGVATVNAYQAFYLIMVHGVDPATVGTSILIATSILSGVSLLLAPVIGKISDRVGRRKPFVIVAAIVFGLGLGLVAIAPSYSMFLVAVAVMGAGQGVYFAVDFALVTEVLPDPDNPAKDLGLMNLATSLPSTLVPAIAPALLAIGATAANPQNFTALFVAGVIAAFLGAVFIVPIRQVR